MSDLDALRQRCALLEQQIAGIGTFPPGHYHSPFPSMEDVTRRVAELWPFELPRALPGVDLNETGQLALVDRFVPFYGEQPFGPQPGGGLRFGFDNVWFCRADALALYSMMRVARPRRIVEIGSGYSSAVMLDTNDRFFGGEIACTFIEPEPARLQSQLREEDTARHTIVTVPVQEVGLEVFSSLAADDILFVDSSHVSKVGSDVNRILFDILPRLAPGVLIHFHDIGYPFEYPLEWVLEGRAWTEAYLLRAFLQYNDRFRIEWFNPFILHFHRDRFAREMPLFLGDTGGSLWLRALGPAAGRGHAASEGDRRATDTQGVARDSEQGFVANDGRDATRAQQLDAAAADRAAPPGGTGPQAQQIKALQASIHQLTLRAQAQAAHIEAVQLERDAARNAHDDIRAQFEKCEADRAGRRLVIRRQGEEIASLQAEIHRLLQEAESSALQLQTVQLERDVARRARDDVRAQFEASEADRAARLQVIERQGEQIGRLNAEIGRLTQQVRLVARLESLGLVRVLQRVGLLPPGATDPGRKGSS